MAFMDKLVLETWLQKHSISPETSIAIGVSGGPDSMALAHMMLSCVSYHKDNLHFLTVDHGLRDEAKNEAAMVGTWLKDHDGTHIILTWGGDKPDTGIMEVAREARYKLMADYCQHHKIQHLLIAHHQDDQAETFLIRLSKGSGLDGLSAMQQSRAYNDNLTLLRPLLDVPKQDLIEYCNHHDVPHINDPSNENADYLRPRLRQSMGVLAEEGLSAKRLAVTAKRLTRAKKALIQITDEATKKTIIETAANKITYDFTGLKQYHEEIGLRVLQSAMERTRETADYPIRMEKLEDLFASLWDAPESFKPRTLGGCLVALSKDQHHLIITREEK